MHPTFDHIDNSNAAAVSSSIATTNASEPAVKELIQALHFGHGISFAGIITGIPGIITGGRWAEAGTIAITVAIVVLIGSTIPQIGKAIPKIKIIAIRIIRIPIGAISKIRGIWPQIKSIRAGGV